MLLQVIRKAKLIIKTFITSALSSVMNMGGFIPQSFINEAGLLHTELVSYNASITKKERNITLKY